MELDIWLDREKYLSLPIEYNTNLHQAGGAFTIVPTRLACTRLLSSGPLTAFACPTSVIFPLASSVCPLITPVGVVMVPLDESGKTISELPNIPASMWRGADKSIDPGDVALESGVKVPVIGSVWPDESCCKVIVIVTDPSGILKEKVSLLTFQTEPAFQ